MGSSASKPETKVFTPSAPIDFSASFLSQLENSSESDYTRSQYTEKYIQDRVAAELKKLEAETIKKFQDTTTQSLLKETDSKPQLSVPNANERISKLTLTLEENIKVAKVEIDANVKKSRDAVIQCLKENQGKSLQCWEEVSEFKKLVNNL